jgi:hypothetical protein
MEILEPAAPTRRQAPARRPGRGCDKLRGPSRAEVVGSAVAGVVALGAIVGWEIAHPTLPVPFELGAAARTHGAAAWVGRLPMAVAAVGGLVALYMFMARTAERRVAVYAVAVLATVPAWFVHGRTMTGAMVPMACSAAVLGGLGIAALDRQAGVRVRASGVVAAIAAAVVSVMATRWGAPNRGLAVVAGAPVVAVAATALLWGRRNWATGNRQQATGNARADMAAAAVAIAVVGAAVIGACVRPDGALAEVMLGARAGGVALPTTFEAPVAAIAYGLVPWTPLVPFALARRPSSAGHLATMIAAVLAIGIHAALAPRTGSSTIVGVAAIAGAVAAMLRSLEETRRPAVALVATVAVVGWLVAHDVGLSPDRVLVAFGASDTAMPTAQAAASSLAIRSSVWLCMVLTCAALVTPRAWLPAGRGLAIVAGGVFAGLVLRTHAYPELLMRLSPGAAFDAWAKRHRTGEPLGLVGVDPRAVAFAPGTAIVPQVDAPSAGRWLAAADHGIANEPRRFLALAATELPRVNAEYRAAHAHNVPVLAGRGGATLLAASALAANERSESPLDAIVLDTPPSALRPLGAVLDETLDALGWELVDDQGRRIDAVPRGSRRAHVRIVVRVRAGSGAGARASAKLGGHCTFLHVDHSPARFSAEHKETAYPMALWQDGDVVIDDFEVKLGPQFRAGSYRMFWGVGVLPCEGDRRMHVTSGATDGHDRIPAGILEVR